MGIVEYGRQILLGVGSTFIALLLATSSRGDWLFLASAFFAHRNSTSDTADESVAGTGEGLTLHERLNAVLGPYRLANVHVYCSLANIFSVITYFGLCGGLKLYYYKWNRSRAHEWKCQRKWLTPANDWHELMSGTRNLAIGSVYSGTLATYIINGGKTRFYFDVADYGWTYTLTSVLILFFMIEACLYYSHRAYHIPWMYKRFHKAHHRYVQPTPFSSTAMHPVEFLTYQTELVLPIFLVPLHPAAFLAVILYGYYYGIMDHSGVRMDALPPWQPPTTFHDNHHQFFHVNFGFNTYFFDWFHDTLKKRERYYDETTFGGKGAVALMSEGGQECMTKKK